MIFLDSNIVIDLVEPEGRWRRWAEDRIVDAVGARLVVNCIVRAETARQFESREMQDSFFASLGVETLEIDGDSAFHAGRAHLEYRRAGGARTAMLADFLIGGHATALTATLLTRDRARFATYFPDLTLITPETDNG
ncbi:type II toxin-antitoxin system VapC family toxin [Sphingosinithalassobacter sp. CS137]|uniref:type II toxin-antitoxin system VapC family toxin n=1 Tax=Sphingosinithalassobacter sp. CS137 TaxID=2762748 RepID=UPI00165DFBF4|nr:PIN domain-containing protein [Sphingosinithalassobacter sp. CS137]